MSDPQKPTRLNAQRATSSRVGPWVDAEDLGFSPEASGVANAEALQRAVDGGGTVWVSRHGIYDLERTVYLDSDTTLRFGAGVWIRKVAPDGPFTHVLLNRGAMSRTCDRAITVDGLRLIVNSVDHCAHEIFGLRGQLAFFHVRDLRVTGFRCYDLPTQISLVGCTFDATGDTPLLDNEVPGKSIVLHASASLLLNNKFKARIVDCGGDVQIHGDLPLAD